MVIERVPIIVATFMTSRCRTYESVEHELVDLLSLDPFVLVQGNLDISGTTIDRAHEYLTWSVSYYVTVSAPSSLHPVPESLAQASYATPATDLVQTLIPHHRSPFLRTLRGVLHPSTC